MRPIVAIAGAAILVVLALLAYFVPSGYSQPGSLYIGTGTLHSDGPGAAVVLVPTGDTFLPSVPVNVTVTNAPVGSEIFVFPCPIGVTNASSCAQNFPMFIVEYNVSGSGPQTVSLHFNINAGHPFAITTTAARGAQATYTASAPLWATQTWVFVALLVVGLLLVIAGLVGGAHRRSQAGTYGEPGLEGSPSAYTGAPTTGVHARRFCENCGYKFPDTTTAYCPSCGAPRGGE